MIDATLKNAHLVWLDDKRFVAVGEVFGDKTGRFDDGENIKTSVVLSENNGILYTTSSVYTVEWSDKKVIEWDEYVRQRGY